MHLVSVYRKSHFNAAHRLHSPQMSTEENKSIFGKCNNEHYHGHNYEMEVKVTGPIDAKTGYVMDLKVLSDIIENEVCERFDHKNLNLDTEEFKDLNPTAENIVVVIYNIIKKNLAPHLELAVRLYETPRNFVEFNG
jgi:6-pyruvoyltetrahydropterin/6-carboxytetrahydropterin synthase